MTPLTFSFKGIRLQVRQSISWFYNSQWESIKKKQTRYSFGKDLRERDWFKSWGSRKFQQNGKGKVLFFRRYVKCFWEEKSDPEANIQVNIFHTRYAISSIGYRCEKLWIEYLSTFYILFNITHTLLSLLCRWRKCPDKCTYYYYIKSTDFVLNYMNF